jgi:hypothetical protein
MNNQGPSPIRKTGEALAKKTYDTLSPAVKATKKAVGKGLSAYLKATEAAAKKVEPLLNKLPQVPQTRHRRRK